MIDIENEVNTLIAQPLRTEFEGIFITGEDIVNIPKKFPCLSIFEADNYPVVKTQDSGSNENHVHVMYEVNVYSNKKEGAKSEFKKILAFVDNLLSNYGLVRTTKQPVTMNDANIYRLFARYEGIADNNYIYRR